MTGSKIRTVTLPDRLLEKLVCPDCKNKLTYDEQKERLVCATCELAYPITGNIPVLLTDEAEKL